MKRLAWLVSLGVVGAVLAVLAWQRRGEPEVRLEQPSVVLVIGCTVRSDQMTPYGGLEGVTPFLAGVAERGVLFADGIAAAPWTRPGVTSVITGEHAVSLGMIEPGAQGNSRVLADRVTTLAERFAAAGYTTHGGTANPNANAVFGFAQGFDHYYEGSGLWRETGMVKVPGTTVVDEVMATLPDAPDRPIFLQVLLTDAHEPYGDVPRDEARALRQPGEPPILGRYRAALRQFDGAVEHLSERLAGRGFDSSNTLFVVVNDHGQGLRHPEHHGHAHGVYTFSSTVEMPWLMWGPGVPQGHVVEGLASQVDVVPTVTALAGLDTDYDGPGHDWSAQARGEARRTTRDRAFVDTWFARADRAAVYTDELSCHESFDMATAPKNKRVQAHTGCYDRQADPLATKPLDQPPEGLLAELRAWREARFAEYQAWPEVRDADLSGDDEDLGAWLEALGYVQ